MGDTKSQPHADEFSFLVRVTYDGEIAIVQAALVRGPFSEPFTPTVNQQQDVWSMRDVELEIHRALWSLLGDMYAKRKRAEFVP
jgi:hypothetical protein